MKCKKIIGLALVAALSLGMLSACGSSSTGSSSASGSSNSTSSAASGTATKKNLSGSVSTNGSTSMEKVIGAINEQFMNDNSGVTVTYDPTGSGTGIKAVTDGTCDIGLSSRALKDEEKASGLESTTIALDGIAIIVNSKSGVTNLTMDQLSQIYTGAITNWSQVGGTDGQIVCIGREAGSGTRDGFESITNTKDKCVLSQELTSTGAVISAVSSNPNAIGYASLADVDTSVKTLSIDGVTPSAATVKDGTYKIQRPFVLVTKKGAKLSDAAQALFDFATSTAANDLISKAGAVPVNK